MLNHTEFAAFVGIDWADQKHACALRAAGSDSVEAGELEQTPEALQRWAMQLAQRFPGRLIAVAIEQARGALLYALGCYQHLVLFPIHPASLARYREVFSPSGAKDDPVDAMLVLDFLLKHGERLQPLQPDTVPTRKLQLLVELRRSTVDDQTRLNNQLVDALKIYFPQILSWFEDLTTPLVAALLTRWPTLERLQTARPDTLRRFFHQHNSRSGDLIEKRLEQIRHGLAAIDDVAVLEVCQLKVEHLLAQIAVLRAHIAQLDKQIAELFAEHPEAAIFQGLPGAGAALAPRLLAAFGTQRDRFETAAQLQCYSGIAPVRERSGTRCWIHFRRACPKFLRQTFHEWAGHSIRKSQWAAAYYQQARSRGKGHHAAIRALAFKWIRILFRCWQDRAPYNEARYLETLRRRRGPKSVVWESCGSFSKAAVISS